MTSRIFLMQGMWDDVISSNQAASAAARHRERNAEAQTITDACLGEARSERRGLMHLASTGQDWSISPPGRTWRFAVRSGQVSGPAWRKWSCRPPNSLRPRSPSRSPILSLRGQNCHAPAMPVPGCRRSTGFGGTEATSSGAPAASSSSSRRPVLKCCVPVRLSRGLAELRRAAELGRTMPVESGPPFVEKPSFELLGDELRRLGRYAQARDVFRAALELAPGRRLSLRIHHHLE